jgi:hypothetical protein
MKSFLKSGYPHMIQYFNQGIHRCTLEEFEAKFLQFLRGKFPDEKPKTIRSWGSLGSRHFKESELDAFLESKLMNLTSLNNTDYD